MNYAKDQVVSVLSSRHPDVIIGTKGKIKCVLDNGYGVEILTGWLIAGSDRGMRIFEPRTVWYPEEEVVLVHVV